MAIISINNHTIDYKDSLAMQQHYFDEAIALKRQGQNAPHYLIFNEHHPVITLGRHAKEQNILISEELLQQQGIALFHTSRGGDVTYHGPGQWTVYPIFDLEELGIGVREYVHRLEEVSIQLLKKYGLKGERIEGASGVWIGAETPMPRKVCAIGIHCSRYITMHGIAFNVNTLPEAFRWINPCGFVDKGVTSLAVELGHEVPMQEVKKEMELLFSQIFERDITSMEEETMTK